LNLEDRHTNGGPLFVSKQPAMSKDTKSNGARDWSDMDVFCLRVALENGDSIEEAAAYVFRRENIDEVRRKADELGLRVRKRRRHSGDDAL
jgi:hypothetical protein